MTVTEACAVNTLLGWLLGTVDNSTGTLRPAATARDAAQTLAAKAHKTLQCGLDPTDIQELWDARITPVVDVAHPAGPPGHAPPVGTP